MSTPSYTRDFGDSSSRASVIPEFFMDAVLDQVATAAQGREIWRDEERVKVIMPGNQLTVPVFKVTDEHRQRWPKEYAAFKEGVEFTEEGTPLEQWPVLSKGQVKELRYLGFKTVENVAAVSDANLQRMGLGARALREMAKSYLDDAAKHALETKLTRENQVLRDQVAAMQNQIEQLNSAMTTLHSQFMAKADAPNPLATMIPGVGAAAPQHEAPAESSLDRLAKRKPGRPRKQPLEDEAA